MNYEAFLSLSLRPCLENAGSQSREFGCDDLGVRAHQFSIFKVGEAWYAKQSGKFRPRSSTDFM